MGIDQLCVMCAYFWEKHHNSLNTPTKLFEDQLNDIYFFQFTTCTDYSGTPLNKHPSTADTQNITDNSESPGCPSIHLSNPWIPDTPLRITNSVHAPNYTEPRLQKHTGSPWVSDTSLQGTKCCLPMVSVIEEFHCSVIPVAPVFGHLQ